MTFSQRIRDIRKGLRMSQEKFGELAGVSQRTVAFWEAGDRTPSYDVLVDIANQLDVSVDYLLGRSDEPKQKEPAISDDELRISTLDRLMALPEPVLLKVLDLIDALQAQLRPGSGSASPAPRGSSDPGAHE